jgi:hypothetical protein
VFGAIGDGNPETDYAAASLRSSPRVVDKAAALPAAAVQRQNASWFPSR